MLIDVYRHLCCLQLDVTKATMYRLGQSNYSYMVSEVVYARRRSAVPTCIRCLS